MTDPESAASAGDAVEVQEVSEASEPEAEGVADVVSPGQNSTDEEKLLCTGSTSLQQLQSEFSLANRYIALLSILQDLYRPEIYIYKDLEV